MADGGSDTVIFLERDKFFLYNGGGILSLNFPANLVSDLDVKDKEAVFNLVTTFIQNSKLEPTQIFFVISEAACFSKDFPIKDPADVPKIEDASQAFIDAVPFNSTLSKIYKTPTVYRAVATNQELIDVIIDAFISKGYGLTTLVPANIYPEYGATRELTEEFARHVIATREMAKTSNMVGEKVAAQTDHELSTSIPAKPKSKLLPYLIIGFVVLLVILIYLLTRR